MIYVLEWSGRNISIPLSQLHKSPGGMYTTTLPNGRQIWFYSMPQAGSQWFV